MNPVKKLLQNGEFVAACWHELASPDVAELLVRSGWPVIVVDGEHGSGDLEQWVSVARAIEAAGGHPVLRVPHAEPWMLNKILDRGFRSLIVPRVNTPAAARAIVEACYYPPRGSRGYAAPIVRASGFGERPNYALEEAHDELLLMVQCEHVEAVENIDELTSIEGIDAIFIGPNDLAGSVHQLERLDGEKTQSLIRRVEAACKGKKMLATITTNGRGFAELKALGYSFAVGINDLSALAGAMRNAARERDAAMGIFGEDSAAKDAPRY